MLRAITTRKLALGVVLAILAASIPPLRAAVLDQLGASPLHFTAADDTAAAVTS